MLRIAYIFIMLLALSIPLPANAQYSYTEIDSTTYWLYVNEDWEALVAFGEKVADKDVDFFYYNLRLGIAHFRLNEYESSKNYLEKANHNNSFNQIVKEYLFWCNYHLLKENAAEKWYAQLDDSIQQRIDYHQPKKLNSIYLEGGVKFSNDRNIAKELGYFNVSLQHHLTGKINLKHSFIYSKQNLNWGGFEQFNYYINPSYLFNKSLRFNLGLHGAHYSSRLNYYWKGEYQSAFAPGATMIDTLKKSEYEISGSYKEHDLLIQPGLTKNWEHFSLSTHLSIYLAYTRPSYQEYVNDTSIITVREFGIIVSQNTEVTDNVVTPVNRLNRQFGIGTNLYINYPYFTLGADMKFIVYSGAKKLFISPFAKFKFGKKVQLSTYYFSKEGYSIGLFEGAQLLNTADDVNKFSLTGTYNYSKGLDFYLTYQIEKILDKLNLQEYKLNSFFIGVKLKL